MVPRLHCSIQKYFRNTDHYTIKLTVKENHSLADMDMSAWMGLQAIIQTIMMGKMEMVFPDMYMMNKFMGICFKGPRATSQQRCLKQTIVLVVGIQLNL